MESGLSLLISVVGLVLAIPGAMVSFRDWRRGHRSPDKPAVHALARDAPTSGVDAPTSGPGAGAAVASERRSQTSPHAGVGPAGRVSVPRRLLSFLIDIYSLTLPASAIAAVIDPSALSTETEDGSTAGNAALFAAMTLMVAGYVVIMGRTGRSLGKLVVGARLERADTPGKPPGTARTLLHVLVASLLWVLSYLYALSREDRRALHDLVAGTRAVRSR